jgi:hypothetical protein
MRIGDAERAQVADRLGKHYSDGRLDETELNDRLDRAMRAKTMGDLTGLLSDMPETEPGPTPGAPGGDRRHQRKMQKIQLDRERLRLQAERREHKRAVRQRRLVSLAWVAMLVAIAVVALVVAHTLMHSIAIWVIVGVVIFLWLRNRTADRDKER